ncbi:MAG: T9SS type A sorting domain-containing protein [Bacteroidales bacterium]|nr:T9SS type A sorting domain-containing protein [Bacteroidales bacterium]
MKNLNLLILSLAMLIVCSQVFAQYQKAWELNGDVFFGGIANVDNDPDLEMVFEMDGKAVVYNAITGEKEWESYDFGDGLSSVQLINVDNDNKSEILVFVYYSSAQKKYVLYYYDDIGDLNENQQQGFKSINYPNPFRSSTTIEYNVPETAIVLITFYNEQGNIINRIDRGKQTKGAHRFKWDCHDMDNQMVKPGMYFYTITSGNYVSKKKVIKL